MSVLRTVALGAVLLAFGCSSTDPPESSLGRPAQPDQRTAPTSGAALDESAAAGPAAGSDLAAPDPTKTATAATTDAGAVAPSDPSVAEVAPEPADGKPDMTGKPDESGKAGDKPDRAGEPDESGKADKAADKAGKAGKPRDIKVLPKSWSLDRVEKYMKAEVERGLGVKCAFCHDENDYAADHAHKEIARRMMRMTRDLNRQFFKGHDEITCYTCHKGKKEP